MSDKITKNKMIPDFSTYNNRTVIAGTSQEKVFSEDRFIIGWIRGTGEEYAIVYDGNVEIISHPGTDNCGVSFILRAGHTLKTNSVGTYSLAAWKLS